MAVLARTLKAQKPRNAGMFMIALGVAIALLYVGRVFLITLTISIIIAFLLDPFVEFLRKFKLPRALGSFVTCTLALLFLYLAGLGLFVQAEGLVADLPRYSDRINELVDAVAVRVEAMEAAAYNLLVPKRLQLKPAPPPQEPPSQAARRRRPPEPVVAEPAAPPSIPEVRIRPERSPVVNYLYSNLRSFYQILLMSSFVPFLVYFMLSWRDHMRRSFLQLFEGEDRHAAGRSWDGIASMARAYVVGNFVLGILLTLASGLFFWSIKLPYFLLVAPISGFLSLVPYVGVPLAMIPPFFVALPIYQKLPAYLIIGAVVGFFHLLALNLLYPKLVGSRVHLNPLAVTIALMFWGTLWGGIGLVLAIPITAGIKAVLDNNEDLVPYARLLGD